MKSMYKIIFLLAICSISLVEGAYNGFDTNPYISEEAREMMRPYLMPEDHPAKKTLDKLFRKANVTKNVKSFSKAGFVLRHAQPRSFIRIAGHEDLKGYLIKAHLDDEEREKFDRPSWWWFVKRCEGSRKIAKVIEENNIQKFKVAKKWIYPLPVITNLPPMTLAKRKQVILVVEDMEVLSTEETLKAWKKKITMEDLDNLYKIVSKAGGRSYRPENIPYTKNKTFAFVDTEYPDHPGSYKDIERAIPTKLKPYWKELVSRGGR